jgi:uncharacterized SAM-binding protein YcdF (DUF218 family)
VIRFFLLLLGGLVPAFAGLCLWIWWQGTREDLVHADAIVVLGAAQWAGRPSPVLQARLERGIELYEQGFAPLLVLTGGSVPGDPDSEASVGQAYALARGVPAENILIEESSRTTVQNLRGAWELLAERGASSVLLVSDPFHMGRALYIARRQGFDPHPAPTRSSPISREPLNEFRYVVREAFALVGYWLTGE